MPTPKVTTIDFETEPIKARPHYPPKPVGVSIKRHGSTPKYYAWGHPTQNNCTEAEGRKLVREELVRAGALVFHNAKFDMDVAEAFTGYVFEPHDWARIHDTQFLLFLHDPHSPDLQLKPSAARILGMVAEEQNKLKEWILENVEGAKPGNWGGFICMAPGNLVGRYANGDTDRTDKLFKKLLPKIVGDGMGAAYDRERKLLPIFRESERLGLRVDVAALRRDIPLYQKEFAKIEAWLLKRLGLKELNFDADAQVAKALDKAGIVTEWTLTKTGKKSTSKKTMTVEKFNDRKFFLALGYRNRLATCLRMFMEPWLDMATASGGFILPTWNQVRQAKGDRESRGTRTGRPSCEEPNLLNLSKSFENRGDDYTHPTFIKGLLHLPLVRSYMLPDAGCEWIHRDYNQQELRLLAHFEDGDLKDAYNQNPKLDVHTFVGEAVHGISGVLYDRVTIKTTVFGRIYGQGQASLALRLRRPTDEIKAIRDAQNAALPGLPALDRDIKDFAREGKPICTWGGRLYHCEPPKFVEKFNREMSFEYKLINYLIQGSAADATKEAIIRFWYHKARKANWRFLVTVYDEINICAPKIERKAANDLLRECMESIELDVPLLTDGAFGSNWGNLKKEA